MRRVAGLLLLLLAACGEAAPIPATGLQLSVSMDTEAVELGRGFGVTVVRIWSKDLVPEAWDDALLAPLALVPEAEERREDARRVMETRRFRAYAFARRDVVVPSPTLRATPVGGGEVRMAKADSVRLRVTPLLDPADPGAPELPGAPLPERVSWAPLWAGLALALAVGAMGLARTRRRAGAAPAESTASEVVGGAQQAALEALERLRAEPAATPEAVATTVRRIAVVMRRYLHARFDLRTRERTSPEILRDAAACPELAPASRAALAEVFTACDLTKFATHAPTSSERDALLDTATGIARGVPA